MMMHSMSNIITAGTLISVIIAIYVAVNYSKLAVKKDHNYKEVPIIILMSVFVFLMIFILYVSTGEMMFYHYIIW